MKTNRKSSTALAVAIAIILSAPSTAWSDEGRDSDHDRGWNKRGPKVNVHYNNHYNGRYAAKGRHYYPPRYAYYPCSKCGKKHHHNNHDHDNDKLWIGLLGGGILGYGLGVYQNSHSAEPDQYQQVANVPPPPEYANTAPVNTCLQQREYNTKIMVGGKQVDGYGTACLQPDGSWRYGAAQPEPY